MTATSPLRRQVKTGRGIVDAQRVASTSTLPETAPAFRRSLDILYCQPPMAASIFGAKMWPEGKGRVANHGGGAYGAQMMLGRLRKAGYARVADADGSSRWELTDEGKKMCRPR